MTWHMVEQYGLPSPVDCMTGLLAGTTAGMRVLLEDPELSELQKTDRAIECLSRVAALSYLLRSGWSTTTYRAFRDPLLERLNDFDRVRAAHVIEATLGERAPEDWHVSRALPLACDWLCQELPAMLYSLQAPADEVVSATLLTLASHCLEARSWLGSNDSRPSGARLAKLLRQGRRLLVVLELFDAGLSEDWRSLRPALAAWVESLERWTQVRRVARTLKRCGSAKSRERLRRSERRQRMQTLELTAALQSQPRVSLVIDWFEVVQEHLVLHSWTKAGTA